MVRIILHAKFIVDLVIQHSYGNLSICKLCLMKKLYPVEIFVEMNMFNTAVHNMFLPLAIHHRWSTIGTEWH